MPKFDVLLTSSFKKELKKIAKKHLRILGDVSELIIKLSENPRIGANLGKNIYKIRLAISGTGKGTSGGARVITYVHVSGNTVILAEIYLKSEFSTTDVGSIIQRLASEGLI